MSLPSFGTPVTIAELSNGTAPSVCIVGAVAEYNMAEDLLLITHQGQSCTIDVSLVPAVPYTINRWVQVVGEVKWLPEGPRVVARVLRPMDGLNVDQYCRAMQLLRSFLS
eukprot:GGOE01058422.1.p2 GENE.GGOE01058422.1~~GGOE01058422.1.p2  ORF type:complete len:110 (-),score=23.26 GGOE01058422.1:103-432(-)